VRLLSLVAGVLALIACPASVRADAIGSVYTKLDLDKCRHQPGTEEEDEGEWFCTGYAGIAVHVSSAHAHSFVSFGRNAKRELAAEQTLRAFNSEGSTIEWRVARTPDAKMRPFAAIMRWSTTVTQQDDSIYRGQVLVVTRLAPGGVCHVGYVDARANPDANRLAQKIADGHARNFRCGTDQPIEAGHRGPGFSGLYPRDGN
jgi:hypothetical protein